MIPPGTLFLTLLLADPFPAVPIERLGRLDHPAIREASGIVRSRRHPGIFWVHNDSGNPPALFAVRRDGTLVREYRVGVPNVDWEDIATDDHGHLFIGEIGNNGGKLPVRAVYQLDEPDPFAEDGSGPLKVTTASYYRFPAAGAFDAEGLFIQGDRAWIVAKTFDQRPAELYTIPLKPPATLVRPAIPEKVGSLPRFNEPATGADLSPDGSRLVVCSLHSVGVYQQEKGGGWTPIALRSFESDDQIEAVAWDGDDIVIAGEKRGIFRIRSSDWLDRKPSATNAETNDK